ncbi:MAG: TonB-dependent receptor plug domain-containing protein [Saprospiraceae bacterium]|nr:TonB-dependent receptor plug domain-containing protein [Saprospiraceae bacterium]
MAREIFFLTICLFSVSLVMGQGLTGRVYDDLGKPVFAANIFIGTTLEHTHSNELGFFELPGVRVGDTLKVSSLGYAPFQKIIDQGDLESPLLIKMTGIEYDLSQISISDHRHSTRQLAKFDLNTNPVTSSQEILQRVPGLIIGQHAGGGKAEQMFLRGFDLDHGTDINISMDGMPVNMVSHAHGQGYADLHFIIPEVVDRINYEKGPYQARLGNLATAGGVSFETVDQLANNLIGFEYGRYNTLRLLGMVNLLPVESNTTGYIAIENLLTDGLFESSQDFHRNNVMTKFGHKFESGDQISILASHFTSRWNASGQIPQRAVDEGMISRFGAIDDTEGGETSRTNVIFSHAKNLGKGSFLKTNAYYSHYDFNLFSNFTFFLNDPENGDQIHQQESRNIIGLTSTLFKDAYWGSHYLSQQAGAGFRNDDIQDIRLSHTLNRKTTLDEIYDGDILETNFFAFYDASIDMGYFTLSPGIRVDHFKFDYDNHLSSQYDYQSKSVTTVSPKLTLTYSQNPQWQYYLKAGKGFHSNDTRGIIASINDPEVGEYKLVPAAYGVDLGTFWRATDRLVVNVALWYLQSEQEFVYVGDEGIVEASGKSRRLGLDLGIRAQLHDHVFAYVDYNLANARSVDEPAGADYIPLAPIYTVTGGLTYKSPSGLSGGLRMVHIGDRPANEDYTITAEGYLRFDGNLEYEFQHFSLGVIVQNLLNTKWNETQFATESRLNNETESIEEIHFTPGIPFAPRLKIGYRF